MRALDHLRVPSGGRGILTIAGRGTDGIGLLDTRKRTFGTDPQPTLMLARGSSLAREVVLCRCFSNPRKALTSLISRVHKASKPRGARRQTTQRADVRGPVVGKSRQTQTRLNASNRAALLAAYSQGEPVQALADRFGVHRGTVSVLVRRAGLPRHGLGLPESTRRQAARLYAEGLTLPQVAARLGISNDGARAGIIACGGTIRPRGRRPASKVQHELSLT